jgi:hypothetical protein
MILLDEYFALDVTFGIIMTFFLTKMYYMVDKVVTVMENEFTQPNYQRSNSTSANNFEFKPSEIPPPPPPIPDEWFEENQEWLGN